MGPEHTVASNGERTVHICEVRRPKLLAACSLIMAHSLDGAVKLFDIRGTMAPAQEWEMYPHGLSAFDVHELTGVFAA